MGAMLEPFMPERKKTGRPRTTALRDVMDAILYMTSTGCQWAMLPNDFPPSATRRCNAISTIGETVVCCTGWRSFFKSRHGICVLGMMARPGRELGITQGAQLPAQGLPAHRQAELIAQPLHQINQPPAHHTMDRRQRAALDDRQQTLAVSLLKDQRFTRPLTIQQTVRAIGVETQHPIANHLQTDAADPRRILACATDVNLRQRQKPARLWSIITATCKCPQILGRIILAKRRRNCHGELPSVLHGETHFPLLGGLPRESSSLSLGIRTALFNRDRIDLNEPDYGRAEGPADDRQVDSAIDEAPKPTRAVIGFEFSYHLQAV